MFKPVDTRFDVPALEHEIIRFWEEHDIEAKYLSRNESSDESFSFIDGPITANGLMGVHHAWGRTYKDVWQRYHTMLGHKQRYQNGFDCQGLWVEVTVERELGFTSKRDIESYGIAEFVRKCKESVFHFAAIQTAQSKRLGYFMDWDHSYFTLSDENNYSVWNFLKTCHEKGWLYKGRDVMPWCVRCGTGLSEQEVATTEYEELVHTSAYVKFPLVDRPNESLLVWTTTPWTLTSNVGAAVNPENNPDTDDPVIYVKAELDGHIYYAAKNAIDSIAPGFRILEELRGADMLGWRYRGPFDELPAEAGVVHRVIPWTDVSATEGTGIVHIAPGAGKEDFQLGKEFGLTTIAPLDEAGNYVAGFDWLTGRNVLEVAGEIIDDLRRKGILFRAHEYAHRYPMCWRCRTPLVFRMVDEWFIALDDLRHRMMNMTETIRWIPSFGRERELDWLRNMGDWMISKKRYWGLALPIFECRCGHVEVLGGKADLFERAVSGLEDLESPHRPWIDAVRIKCSSCDELVERVKDVGNPWLDAGIVPFSTLGYNDDPDYWRQWFPADFITESFPGQFRNWFYSMIAQAAALEDTRPFKTVLGYALLRDLNGREMHKSWGNLIPFDEAADGVGADLMRWLFCLHAPESNLNFGYTLLDSVKSRLLTLWNTYSFFVTYANLDGFNPSGSGIPMAERTVMDRWIMARLQQAVRLVRESLDDFDSASAVRAIDGFVEDLSTWYVRRCRRRFWKSGKVSEDTDKTAAYVTLYECLRTTALLLAPFIPHVAEEMYQNLVREWTRPSSSEHFSLHQAESVHLCDFPKVDVRALDESLLQAMEAVRKIVSLGRAAREQVQLRVRQPLARMYVTLPASQERAISGQLRETILEELNVKDLRRVSSGAEFVDYRVRPNLPVLGKKYGRAVPEIRAALDAESPSSVAAQVERGDDLELHHEGSSWTLQPDEILVEAVRKPGFTAAAEEGYVVALDIEITPELRQEGLARELARSVNELRKELKLNLDDRITLTIVAESEGFRAVAEKFGDYVARETLAEAIIHSDLVDSEGTGRLETDGERITFAIAKV